MSTDSDAADKAARRAARKAAKKLAKDALPSAPVNGTAEPEKSSKKRKLDDEGAIASIDDSEKAAKAQRKLEKKQRKAAKAAAASAASSAASASEPSAPIASTSTAEQAAFLTEHSISHEPDSAATEYPPVLSFDALPLTSNLHASLATFDFKSPTPIQSASWGVLFKAKDCVAIAETGSGKTMAFGLPGLHYIMSQESTKKAKSVAMLVVAPTRELAMQTHVTLEALGRPIGLGAVCIYGGVSKDEQKRLLRANPRIVVGTPGRLLDLAREECCDLSHVSCLVLDEADRMLDKGFENDIRTIIGMCKTKEQGRRTSMFSATWPTSVRRLAADFMSDPIRITVGSDELTASTSVEQTVKVLADSRMKDDELLRTLSKAGFKPGKASKAQGSGASREKCLVFALYKKEAVRVENYLSRNGYEVCCIQGDLSQDKRTKALDDFKTGKAGLMVATDVAARGLDIPKVELVINYTFPLTIEDYIHRIGRTGRAGRKGKSITFFVGDHDKAHAGELTRVLKDAKQEVPEALTAFGGTIKKKEHSAYGAHFRDDIKGTAKKIIFD
ncbi:uncharacterized protein L969DRAFT_91738 [Mixia osmundae IAM 14324]|uniref:RNA helicase n=1 Tax=Mixia osmundae (strain CBS 9802 / IAM 14324 / JCM 22182 / KY 12970) TaxID=764103 RepID=G7E0D1_MIXOS|nr:uncharacterized protein L969DRAFT_91738 [Mixia osmundae IAM 14324]KEI42283.1 hypothetical protein L969DRAFT_91738 [Mixia osmundae IAM 14324]GAA96291.1 hypothetical protein E5Q_02957 [Mixia osmundae IAM 14324]